MHSLNCYFPLYQFDTLRLEVVKQLDFVSEVTQPFTIQFVYYLKQDH